MSYPSVRNHYKNYTETQRANSEAINSLRLGKTNNVFEVTLDDNAASTTVTLPAGFITDDCHIDFMPRTANAVAELYGGTMLVTKANVDPANNQFTITHANNAQTDREFTYILTG